MPSSALPIALALMILGQPAAAAAQDDAAALTDAQIEQFLRTAKVVKTRDSGKGVTASLRATLSDGTLTHDAHVQMVDEFKREFRTPQGLELDFRDNWRFNVAAYRIDRLIGLNLVPVSVERIWNSRPAAVTWWVDDVMMDEGERLKKSINAPVAACWNEQMWLIRMFDQLIDNTDRNLGNLLITNSWRLWGIDHTRAFRYSQAPRDRAKLGRIDRSVLEKLTALDFATLKRDVGKYLSDADIRLVLQRRDGIVAHFQGASSALFERRDYAVGCTAGPPSR
jgi:hypothetical protein